MRKKLKSVAWFETGSILIKKKRKHLSKMSDRVSKCLKRKHLKVEIKEGIHRSLYCIVYVILFF